MRRLRAWYALRIEAAGVCLPTSQRTRTHRAAFLTKLPTHQKKRQRDQPGYASATFPTTHRRPHTSQALPRRAHNIADCGVTWSGDEQLKLGGGRDSVSCLPSLWPVSNQHDATPTIARNADLSAGTATPQERVTARHIHGGLTRTAHTTKRNRKTPP